MIDVQIDDDVVNKTIGSDVINFVSLERFHLTNYFICKHLRESLKMLKII